MLLLEIDYIVFVFRMSPSVLEPYRGSIFIYIYAAIHLLLITIIYLDLSFNQYYSVTLIPFTLTVEGLIFVRDEYMADFIIFNLWLQGLMQYHEEIVEYFKSRGVLVIFLFRRNHLRRMISILANSYDQNAKPLNGTHKSHVHSSHEVCHLLSVSLWLS